MGICYIIYVQNVQTNSLTKDNKMSNLELKIDTLKEAYLQKNLTKSIEIDKKPKFLLDHSDVNKSQNRPFKR